MQRPQEATCCSQIGQGFFSNSTKRIAAYLLATAAILTVNRLNSRPTLHSGHVHTHPAHRLGNTATAQMELEEESVLPETLLREQNLAEDPETTAHVTLPIFTLYSKERKANADVQIISEQAKPVEGELEKRADSVQSNSSDSKFGPEFLNSFHPYFYGLNFPEDPLGVCDGTTDVLGQAADEYGESSPEFATVLGRIHGLGRPESSLRPKTPEEQELIQRIKTEHRNQTAPDGYTPCNSLFGLTNGHAFLEGKSGTVFYHKNYMQVRPSDADNETEYRFIGLQTQNLTSPWMNLTAAKGYHAQHYPGLLASFSPSCKETDPFDPSELSKKQRTIKYCMLLKNNPSRSQALMKKLRDSGLDPELKQKEEWRMFQVYGWTKGPEFWKPVIDQMENLDAVINGETALTLAAGTMDRDIVDYLLSKGANPNITNAKGETYKEVLEKRKQNEQSHQGPFELGLKPMIRRPSFEEEFMHPPQFTGLKDMIIAPPHFRIDDEGEK